LEVTADFEVVAEEGALGARHYSGVGVVEKTSGDYLQDRKLDWIKWWENNATY
jgi:hypothetical protein